MKSLSFDVSQLHGILRLSFSGDLHQQEGESLRSSIAGVTRESFHDLIWDFSEVGELSARCFGVLAFFFTRAILEGFRPVCVDPKMELLSSCYMAGIARSIEFVRNIDEGFEYYLEGLKVNYNRLFCQLLVREKYLSKKELEKALVAYKGQEGKIPFGKVLMQQGLMSSREIVKVITKQKSYLGEILIEQNILGKKQLNEILKEQAKTGKSEKLGDLLQRLGLASNQEIYAALHTQFKRRRKIR